MRHCPMGRVKSGPRKGRCRKHKVAGAAASARACKGNKGESFRSCIRYVSGGVK